MKLWCKDCGGKIERHEHGDTGDCVKCGKFWSNLPKEGPGYCGYCGEPTGSPDPDILCSDCCSTFGHARLSEL